MGDDESGKILAYEDIPMTSFAAAAYAAQEEAA
jgi:hypothetical protein